jgi:predicted HicB family RNase H-like nuclease
MPNYSYSVAWSPRDAAYVALSPEFPGLSAIGAAPADAIKELEVAIELALETYAEAGERPPAPSLIGEYSGQFRLRLPKSLHQGLVLRAGAEGVSLNALVMSMLARGLGSAESELKCTKQYGTLLASWQLELEQMRSTVTQFKDDASNRTQYAGEFQDSMLRSMYADAATETLTH